jgi:hypothetical protein
VEAVLPRSAGRSRAGIRQLVIEELRARNRPVPGDRMLDPYVEQIMLSVPFPPPLAPDASAFTVLKTVVRFVRQSHAQNKKIAAAMSGTFRPMEGSRGQPPYLVEKDWSLPMADVVLDPGAAAILEQLGDHPIVSLERDPEARVGVYAGPERLGTLSDEDGARYQPALDAAQRSGRALMVWSTLSRRQDGTPRLQVNPAGIL